MKKRRKRLAVLLGVAMLAFCQTGNFEVRAEEPVPLETAADEGEGSPESEDGTTETDNSGNEETVKPEVDASKELEKADEEAAAQKPENENVTTETDDSDKEKETTKAEETSKESEKTSAATSPEEPENEEIVTDVQKNEENVTLGADADGDFVKALAELGDTNESEDDTESDSQQFKPAAGLEWDKEIKGLAKFQNTNVSGVIYWVGLYCDDKPIDVGNPYYYSDDYDKDEYINLYFFEKGIDESGTYKFKIYTLDAESREPIEPEPCTSAPYVYTKPSLQLSTPGNGSWDKDGTFSCEQTNEEGFGSYGFRVTHGEEINTFGSNVVENTVDTVIENGQYEFNLNEFLLKYYDIVPVSGDYIEVRASSGNTEKYTHSDYSDKIVFGGGVPSSDNNTSSSDNNTPSDSSSSSNEDNGSAAAAKMWEPTTPDEIRRYAVYSREKVEYIADPANAYSVVINNAMQGKLCFNSFEAVLGDFTIGRTYDIIPSNSKDVYKMDSRARITLSIPKSLQAEGREYKMICVSEKGQPVILDDLDSAAGTITFETDTYHAFALVYKNAAISN